MENLKLRLSYKPNKLDKILIPISFLGLVIGISSLFYKETIYGQIFYHIGLLMVMLCWLTESLFKRQILMSIIFLFCIGVGLYSLINLL